MRVGRVEVGQRSETVHRANLSAIVRRLHEQGPRSRSELVAATGLTRSAIRALVGELAAAGLAAEQDAIRLGTPGRPSPIVELVPTSAVVLTLEILVDSIAAAIVGLGGETLAHVRLERPRREHSVDEVVADLARLADELRAQGDWPIVGIGVAVAGIVRRSDGLVSMAPNLGWIDVPLGARLARALSVAVPISVLNDADAGVLGEHLRGAAVGVDNVLYVSGEVGIGGGLIVDGRLLTGASGFAGEIGHVTVNPGGTPCRCGSTGCLETEIGERVLLIRAGHAADEGRAGIDAVLGEAGRGGQLALAALEHVGRWMGIGLGGVVNVINPRVVILGGPNARLLPFIQAPLMAELERHSLAASRSDLAVVPAALGADAPLLGAAEMAFDALLSDPAAFFGRTPRSIQRASA